MDHSLRFDRDMSVPTFVDLQGFPLGRLSGFIVKEFAALRGGNVLAHYIFDSPQPWDWLMKSEKSCASWLTACHHGLRWGTDGVVPYRKARQVITTAVLGAENPDNKEIVYVKGHEKREWLGELLLDSRREYAYIESLDVDYEDVDNLNNLDDANTFQCGQHRTNKHCAIQNVFKLFNWWTQLHE